MHALPGIYQDGQISFPYDLPDYIGPVCVLVIFPGPIGEIHPPDSMVVETYDAAPPLPREVFDLDDDDIPF